MKLSVRKIALCLTISICLVLCCYISVGAYTVPKKANFNPEREAALIENEVNAASIININASGQSASINGDTVAQKNAAALESMNGFVAALEAKDMHLNREVANTVTVCISGLSLEEFAEIVINADDLDKIRATSNLKIVFNESNEYIILTNESINEIADTYKEFRFQIRKRSDTYSVRFLDRELTIVPKYCADVRIALPASSREQTVYLYAFNQQENWGGQYLPSVNAIEFATKYGGDYNVAAPEIVINDIGSLSEMEQQAIRFMVVRGYFDVENNKFFPSETLTRYDFAEALVRMLFALDNDAVCTFVDVDEKYYKYVAASQQSNIVEGFGNGKFKGYLSVTVEQVIALASRTINQKNGYVYPEQPEKYLNFPSSNTISPWAEKEIALAVREGIYSKEMGLQFTDDISRKDAALLLYRLFMIMNNSSEEYASGDAVVEQRVYHETVWTKSNAIIVCSVTAAAVVIFALISFLFVKNRRHKENQ